MLYKPRHKIVSVTTVANGTGGRNFTMTLDSEGNRIPRRFKIIQIGVKPSASTIRGFRLFSKASRISDAGNDDYSLMYEDTWSEFTEATDELSTVQPNLSYIDDDGIVEQEGTIYGEIEVKSGATDAAFKIDIHIMETQGA